jgi:hypothetical protein
MFKGCDPDAPIEPEVGVTDSQLPPETVDALAEKTPEEPAEILTVETPASLPGATLNVTEEGEAVRPAGFGVPPEGEIEIPKFCDTVEGERAVSVTLTVKL